MVNLPAIRGAKSRQRPPSPSPTLSQSRKHAAVPPVPATALAALRTLLTGMARKCFRMTPHAQAVIPLQSSSGLVALATEVLEEIIFHLDAPRDLCALGTTCQRFRDIVHPWHTEYRFIRCRPSSALVWLHLAAHPLLARNVRHLHITNNNSQGEAREIVPSRAHTQENEMDVCGRDRLQDQILCALGHMTTLAKFSWSFIDKSIYFGDILPTILMCSSLREVEVTGKSIFNPFSAEGKSQSETFELPNLTCVTIRSERQFLDRIQGLLLSHCPNLTTLCIESDFSWYYPLADEFFLRGRWPSLSTLKMERFKCSRAMGFNLLAAFLAAHPYIETLDLRIFEVDVGDMQLELPPGTLPRLRHLACCNDVAAVILGCPLTKGQTRPLEVLKGVVVGAGRNGAFIEGLRLCPRLKRVELEGYGEISDVKHLAEAAHSITWLKVGSIIGRYGSSAVPSNDWAPVLSELPELTSFHGVCFFHPMGTIPEVASTLIRVCPKLRQVDHWNNGMTFNIGKKGNEVIWEVGERLEH